MILSCYYNGQWYWNSKTRSYPSPHVNVGYVYQGQTVAQSLRRVVDVDLIYKKKESKNIKFIIITLMVFLYLWEMHIFGVFYAPFACLYYVYKPNCTMGDGHLVPWNLSNLVTIVNQIVGMQTNEIIQISSIKSADYESLELKYFSLFPLLLAIVLKNYSDFQDLFCQPFISN